jgi:photosystem II stability/assembly factor-like uncharacterized protein
MLVSAIYYNSFGQWEQMNGPYAGYINNVFAIGDTLYCTNYNQVFKSTNKGDDWVPIINSDGIIFKEITEICVKDSIFIISTRNGTFKSVNYGNKYNKLHINACDTFIKGYDTFIDYPQVIYMRNNDSYIFAMTTCGFYSMRISDTFWIKQDSSKTNSISSLYVKDSVIIYGAYKNGIWLSYDMGETWQINTVNPDGNVYKIINVNNDLFAFTSDGIYISKDNGLNWSDFSYSLPNVEIINIFEIDNKTLFVETIDSGQFYSHNNGDSWSKIGDGLPLRSDNYSISTIFYHNGSLYVGYKSSGIFKSDDFGQNWELKNNGFRNSIIIKTTCFGDTLVGISSSFGPGIFRSFDGGKNWEAINNSSIGATLNNIMFDNNKLYISSSKGLFISSDYGNSWTQLYGNFVYSFYANENKIACGIDQDHRIIYSNDYGNNWDTISFNTKHGIIFNIYIHGSDIIISGFDMYFSENSGESWKKISKGNFQDAMHFAYRRNILLVLAGGGLYASYNIGNTFQNRSDNLSKINSGIHKISIYNEYVFACSVRDGIWYSKIGEFNWQQYGSEINFKTYSLSSNQKYFYASTDEGIWRRPFFQDVSIDETKNEMLSDIQVYPNPTNEYFTINLGEKYRDINITVHNNLGQEVQKHHFNNTEAIPLNIQGSSGVYFIEVNADGNKSVLKVIKE